MDKGRIDPEAFSHTLRTVLGTALVIGVFLAIVTQSVVVIPPGYRGVVFNRISGVRQQPQDEGINFVMPFVEQVIVLDIRVQKDSYDATAASKDMQTVHTKVALNYHPKAEATPRLLQEVGPQYSERLIHPAVQEAVKATTARFTAEELITRREDVKMLIKELVEKQVSPHNIKVDELYITDFDFSRQFAESIEAKQIAEQTALKAKRDLDRIKIEAEQKVATARAEAESLRMQKEAITPQLIQLRQVDAQKLAIEKWDGKMPSVIMGGGAMPLLDLNSLTQRPPR
ncbi:MAG: prohibitin family protein [Elusimicrobia bacterium]|nr:prohibitin family protein [Elusimicrobiota bacterium]